MTAPDRSTSFAATPVPTISPPPPFSSASPQEHTLAVTPVRLDERISALDTIRGFGLLGILLMNICGFGLPLSAYANPVPAGGATGLNLFTWCFMNVAADGKMRAIFSVAFGASVYLLIDRLSRKGAAADAADIHYRRMLWLMLFGLMHSYLIWDGDILFPYSLMGLVLYPLRKLSPRALLITAGIMVFGMAGNGAYTYVHLENLQRADFQIQADEKAGKKLTSDQEDQKKEWEDAVKEFSPSPEDLKKETDAHLGGYFKLLAYRAKDVYRFHSAPIYGFSRFDILAMMLIGLALMKLGVLTGSYSTRFYIWMALLSFAIGVPSDTWAAWFAVKQHFSIGPWYLTGVEYEFGRFTAFGYIAVILLVIKSGALQSATRTLAYAGRMAFSNYILTSLICTTLFEGYGFGLFGKLQRYQLYGIVLVVWAVILIISPIWLRHFRFGPLEWAWRSLTYWKKQPFRIQPNDVTPSADPQTLQPLADHN
jgi:uncharacterized protein